jgi:hypothetical protein
MAKTITWKTKKKKEKGKGKERSKDAQLTRTLLSYLLTI